MPENNINEPGLGTVTYANEVVATIAGLAAAEIEGLSQLSGGGGLTEMFSGKKSPTKGIKVEINVEEKTATISIYAIVKYGVRIQETSWKMQENVKKTVENMTDLTVPEVNIFVQGIDIEQKPKTQQ